MIEARLLGILVVDPYHTSKECSRCGQIGNRSGKIQGRRAWH
ncbi:MAG: zinc ribbon domain-containing protein [Conexivisphaerales archaeon]